MKGGKNVSYSQPKMDRTIRPKSSVVNDVATEPWLLLAMPSGMDHFRDVTNDMSLDHGCHEKTCREMRQAFRSQTIRRLDHVVTAIFCFALVYLKNHTAKINFPESRLIWKSNWGIALHVEKPINMSRIHFKLAQSVMKKL